MALNINKSLLTPYMKYTYKWKTFALPVRIRMYIPNSNASLEHNASLSIHLFVNEVFISLG